MKTFIRDMGIMTLCLIAGCAVQALFEKGGIAVGTAFGFMAGQIFPRKA